MKNLLYKEFRLAIHPSVYVFFLLSALLLVPSYPYYVSFFYLTLGLFLTFKTNRAENDIFYYATGSGNDFLNDLEKKKGEPPFKINKYLKNLPTVTVNGKSSLFLTPSATVSTDIAVRRGTKSGRSTAKA